jgi:hypothetical protein
MKPIIPFPACFDQPNPDFCSAGMFASFDPNCCTGTDVFLGLIAALLHFLLIPVVAFLIVSIVLILDSRRIKSAKLDDYQLQKREVE